jgi:hypothetical protein
MRVFDYYGLDDGAKVRRTNDGYMVATPRVARSGIQLYYGSELGMTGDAANKVFKINRPEEEVFSTDSLATYGFKPVTDDHPAKEVTAETWKDYARGQVGGEVLRDQEFIRVPMAVMDSRTIKKVEGGKVEISVGYDCDIEMTAGTLTDGTAYDGSQKNIRVNHVAIVDAARGGAKLRFGDASASLPEANVIFTGDQKPGSKQQEDEKPMKIITVDGISVEVGTDQGGQIIDRHITALKTSATDAQTKLADVSTKLAAANTALETATAKHVTEMAAKDAEVVTLKKQLDDSKLTPAMLDQMVKDRAVTAGKARAVLGDKLVVDGKTDGDIMRQVVDAKLGDLAKGWSEEQVKVSFLSITADVKPQDRALDTSAVLASAFSAAPSQVSDAADKAYEARNARMENAWKGPAANA